jgi:hypothetical protein
VVLGDLAQVELAEDARDVALDCGRGDRTGALRDESVDLVTGFNAFQFAADFVAPSPRPGAPRGAADGWRCATGRIEDRQPFRRPDGSYRFENRFRCLIGVVA